jgi:hypothetical protein
MRRNILRMTLLVVAWTSTTQQVSAQAMRTSEPSLGIGFAVPVTLNTDLEIFSGRQTAVPALSGDFSVAVERVRFYVATELPTTSTVKARHLGSAGYVATYRHRDVPVMAFAGFRMRTTGRVHPIALFGAGPVFWRTTTTIQRTAFYLSGLPQPSSISKNNDVAWALAGGFQFEIAVNARMAIVAGSRARYVWNSLDCGGCSRDPFRGYFGPVSLSTGVGLQVLTATPRDAGPPKIARH